MKREVDFKPGDECVYREDGGETICEVLEKEIEERDGDEWLVMKFKVMQVLRSSPIVKNMRRGEIFSAEKRIGTRIFFVLWEIREISA